MANSTDVPTTRTANTPIRLDDLGVALVDCARKFDTLSIVIVSIAPIFAKKDAAMAKTIGKLIEEEVRRQGWVIKDFASEIFCTRTNVYDIFNRSKMDVAQFFDAMPKVLKNLHIDTNIVMPIMQNEFNDPLPDYGLSDYAIFFTLGERLYDRFSKEGHGLFDVQTDYAPGNQPIDIWHNTMNHQWFVDVKLDYKTEQEWGDIIVHLFQLWMPAIKVHFKD